MKGLAIRSQVPGRDKICRKRLKLKSFKPVDVGGNPVEDGGSRWILEEKERGSAAEVKELGKVDCEV